MSEEKQRRKVVIKSQARLSSFIEESFMRLSEIQCSTQIWSVISDKPDLYVWRIQNFNPVLLDKSEHGKFYEGDSYLILHTILKSGNTMSYDIFIWIGNGSSCDEYGAAAILMVHLDQHFNDIPVQHREVQSYESEKFVSLFGIICILKGGHKSGFRKVSEQKSEAKLFHITGYKQNVQVQEISYRKENLNEEDVYILACGESLYQINGKHCSREEKLRGAMFLNEIKSHHKVVDVEIIDDFSTDTSHTAIGSMPIKGKTTFGLNKLCHKKNKKIREISLFRLSDADGEIQLTNITTPNICFSCFDTNDVFIFDSGDVVYIWVGKMTSRREKTYALVYAQQYADNLGSPNIPLVKVTEGSEPEEMLLFFNK